MPDSELLRFAKNESSNLTQDSFYALKAEFESRGLDLNIINEADNQRFAAEKTKQDKFEQTTLMEFTETIWKFAFDEKEKGKTNRDILDSLIKKNIHPDYAIMLIESIEPKSKEMAGDLENGIIAGWIFLIIGSLLLMFTIASPNIHAIFLLWGFLLSAGAIARLTKSYTQKRKFLTILKNIETEREEIDNNLYQ
ncbi:MAG: hypothetical protein QM791_09895 [Ferruginibacter sp.]